MGPSFRRMYHRACTYFFVRAAEGLLRRWPHLCACTTSCLERFIPIEVLLAVEIAAEMTAKFARSAANTITTLEPRKAGSRTIWRFFFPRRKNDAPSSDACGQREADEITGARYSRKLTSLVLFCFLSVSVRPGNRLTFEEKSEKKNVRTDSS